MDNGYFSRRAALIEDAKRERNEALWRLLHGYGEAAMRHLRGAWIALGIGEAIARLRRRAEARATYLKLRELDDRTLHDIGLHRSELRSLVSEMASGSAVTRLPTLPLRPASRARRHGACSRACPGDAGFA